MTFIEQALKEWNSEQPAWKPVLRFDQLTPALQSEIELRAEEMKQNDQ